MKKLIATLFILPVFVFTNHTYGQAFQKGNINIDLGLGFGAYGTKVTFKDSNSGLEFTETDGAVSTVIPLSFEYGISDRIGLGLQVGMSSYFIDNEDSTDVSESVKSVDFALKFNFHLLNADRNDLFVGLAIGGSSVNWTFKNSSETYSGSGTYFSLYLTDRIFL